MENTASSIRNWSPDDRPREKLLLKGSTSLSDAELLSVLIGSGLREKSAVDLARELLFACSHSLAELARWSASDFAKYPGMGDAKAARVMAAFELSRRRRAEEVQQKRIVANSKDVYEYFAESMGDLVHEEFWAMYLTRNNQVIATRKLGEGGLTATVVDPKKVFAHGLDHKACAVIVAHNHPSGNLQPSSEDRRITRKLYLTGKNLELPVLDHLIITNRGYFSFADEGILDAE